ncbi:hypothetical protein A0256_06465 [Mucilaginibacter sp. PAMC 26640]|nr:hypothetical protein A0256_06465 [Mucilaginibacter sp. PAMC 26640]
MKPRAFATLSFLFFCFFALIGAGHCYAQKTIPSVSIGQRDTFSKTRPKNLHGCTTIAILTGNTCIGSELIASATEPIASVEWFYENPETHIKQSLIKQTGSGPFIYKADVAGGYVLNLITSGGCEVNSNAITVTDLKVPLIKISTKSSVVCPEFPNPVFTGVPTYNGEFPKYQWKVNGINAGAATSVLSPFSVSGLKKGDVITCEMTSSDICITTPTVLSNPITIDDIPVEKPSVTIDLTGGELCDGGLLTFTATTISAGDAPAYQWMVNGVDVPNSNAARFTSGQLKTSDQVSCSIIGNAQVCQVTRAAVSLPYLVVTTPLITPAIAITADHTTADAGSSISFTATVQNSGDHPLYQWMVNNVAVAATGGTFSSTDFKDGDEITCTLISDAACTSSNTVISNLVSVRIVPKTQVIIPSTFTPNGDGVNDTWVISGIETFTNLKVNIYDRYGQRVFHSNGYPKAWAGNNNAGSSCASGVYYYLINLDDKKDISGSVTVLR